MECRWWLGDEGWPGWGLCGWMCAAVWEGGRLGGMPECAGDSRKRGEAAGRLFGGMRCCPSEELRLEE